MEGAPRRGRVARPTRHDDLAGLEQLSPLPEASAARPQHRLLLRDPSGLASSPAAHRLPDRAAVADGLPRHLRARRRRCRPRPSAGLHAFRIGAGAVCTWFFQTLKADVMVLTMLDLQNFHLKRSLHPVHYVYVFHSMGSTHMVDHENSYDHYDSLLCVGPHHVEEIRRREQLQGPAAQAPVPPRLSAGSSGSSRSRPRAAADAVGPRHRAARAHVGRAVDPARLRRAVDRGPARRRHPRDPAPALPDRAARPAARARAWSPGSGRIRASGTSTGWRRAPRCWSPTS